jgi:6-pyruvoyltetrahydropterin/6-carboxytetrahydropterin synthase
MEKMPKMKKLTITKEFKWDCAHRLHNKNLSAKGNIEVFGKCNNVHGHTYQLYVTVSSSEFEDGSNHIENGMIVNFVKLKEIVNNLVVERFDHKLLNDDPLYQNNLSTCENQVQDIWYILEPAFERIGIDIEEIKLFETRGSCATLIK